MVVVVVVVVETGVDLDGDVVDLVVEVVAVPSARRQSSSRCFDTSLRT